MRSVLPRLSFEYRFDELDVNELFTVNTTTRNYNYKVKLKTMAIQDPGNGTEDGDEDDMGLESLFISEHVAAKRGTVLEPGYRDCI